MAMKNRLAWCLLGCGAHRVGLSFDRKTQLGRSFRARNFGCLNVRCTSSAVGNHYFFHKPEFQEGTGPIDAGDVPDFTATDSGLRYRVLRNSGGKKPTADNTVTVNYRGWLNSGKVFDSSYERGKPTTFPLRNVIAGWTEGMQLVGEGGMIELWIPSRLGYGEGGSPGSIPPHSHLHFVVELIHVE